MLPGAELHRCLIRTGLAARVAHSIRVGGGATATRGIGVEPVIQSGEDSTPLRWMSTLLEVAPVEKRSTVWRPRTL